MRALDRAERSGEPRVLLEWFRDRWLPDSQIAWASDEAIRRQVLADAIEKGLVVSVELANVSDPARPSFGVRLDRTHPRVVEALDQGETVPPFRPVPVRGEPLSKTIIRERR
ncbi:MAG TPA: hypothetical protein VMS76_07155 [Planctomycetota bacterium]|nr:hypothetical protein [Planctomycetota bacterium]